MEIKINNLKIGFKSVLFCLSMILPLLLGISFFKTLMFTIIVLGTIEALTIAEKMVQNLFKAIKWIFNKSVTGIKNYKKSL